MKGLSDINTLPAQAPWNSFLPVATCGRLDVISIHSLVRIEALSNYSRLFLSDGRTLFVAKVLRRFEERLDSRKFVRAHNTHLINLDFLAGFNVSGDLCLHNGDCIPVSRRRRTKIMEQLAVNGKQVSIGI